MPTIDTTGIASYHNKKKKKSPNSNSKPNNTDDQHVDVIDDDDFLEPRESMSNIASSSSDTEDNSNNKNRRSSRINRYRISQAANSFSAQSQSDYYDAPEDFFSDGSSISNSSPSLRTNIGEELKALRLSLLEEVERRTKAEKDLHYTHLQWHRLAACLPQVGLSLPGVQHSGDMQVEIDPSAICQEILVTRFVSEAIERALAREETEIITKAVIDSKNYEISRLCDRLQYYEAMNREMSQRNQEVVESTRRRHLRRKMKWRLIRSCVGLSITVGASLLAYSYFPSSVKQGMPSSRTDTSASST